MPPSSKDTKPLPLSDTLHDLAILRASGVDLAGVLGTTADDAASADPLTAEEQAKKQETVAKSYEFVREARAALKILNRGEVEKEGGRVDDVRNGLDEILNGLGNE